MFKKIKNKNKKYIIFLVCYKILEVLHPFEAGLIQTEASRNGEVTTQSSLLPPTAVTR